MALKAGVAVAWGPRPDRAVRAVALDVNQGDRFVHGSYVKSGRRWADLVQGACAVLESRGSRLPGLDLVIAGDVPMGKGLASSAALVTAVLSAFFAASSRDAAPAGIARLVQEVEAKWAGVRCGAMDPYVAALGRPGEAILLDCRTLTHEVLPWPEGVEAVAEDTKIARRLSETPYNERRAEVEDAIARALATRPDLSGVREMTVADFREVEERLPEPGRRRLRHVVTELERVRRAADALRRGDAEGLGRVMDEGHASLSRDFECSTPEIDAMAAAMRSQPGVLGVRLQGAGWGGCFAVLRRKEMPEAARV